MPDTESTFKIDVPQEAIDRLQAKLKLTTFPDELESAGQDYGAPVADIKRLVDRWQNDFDWKNQEAALNSELPQFTRNIAVEGHGILEIHYVHRKSIAANAIPLMFVHGWPGSFLEVRKLLPLLVQSDETFPSFHVVALSLPGFAFSDAPKKKGFGISQHAEVAHKLMRSLGYNEYVGQGGDWGSIIVRRMAILYGREGMKAFHTNMPIGMPPSPTSSPLAFLSMLLPWTWTEKDKAGVAKAKAFQALGSGYFMEQATKPQTIGYSLSDSPAGLLAWVYEKLISWTDKYDWTDDEVLTWISIYHFSRAGPAASVRIYYEFRVGGGTVDALKDFCSVPMGLSFFPGELHRLPLSWITSWGNVIHTTEHPKGGHFAAYEQPEEVARALRDMFAPDTPARRAIS